MKIKAVKLACLIGSIVIIIALLICGPNIYSEYRRNNRTIVNSPIIETGAIYEATLEFDNYEIKRQFKAEMYFGGLQDRAICAIQQEAKEKNIVLPDEFENLVTVIKIADEQDFTPSV